MEPETVVLIVAERPRREAARYVMRRSAAGPDALVSTLGKAAGLMVDNRPRYVRWTPSPFQKVA